VFPSTRDADIVSQFISFAQVAWTTWQWTISVQLSSFSTECVHWTAVLSSSFVLNRLG
jgi:hypothetical protein